jgi:DNA-binding beta-propeller fold protein YncE
VTVGGEAATPSSWSNVAIDIDVPLTVFPGAADVVVTVGGADSNALAFEVLLPRTLYINNDAAPNSLSAFAMDDAGVLTAVTGSPYAMGGSSAGFGGDSSSVTVHRGTRRVFATNNTSVAVYDIDPVDGTLTTVTGSPFATNGNAAYGVTVNDAGTRLFVAHYNSNQVAVFDVAANGQLTHVTGSPFAASTTGGLDTPQLLNNETLLTVTDESSKLFVFSVNAGTGALTEVAGSPFATGGYTFTSRVDPSGTHLFVPDTDNDTLQVFTFDAAGAATQIMGSPFALPTITGNYPNGLAFTPDGSRLYQGTYSGAQLLGFNVAAAVPSSIVGSPFIAPSVTGTTSLGVTRDASKLVSLHEEDQLIHVFSLDATGVPTPVTGSPFANDEPLSDASGLAIGE